MEHWWGVYSPHQDFLTDGMAGKVRRGKFLWGRLFVGPRMARQGMAGKASLGKFWSCGVRQAWYGLARFGPFSFVSVWFCLACSAAVWQAGFVMLRRGIVSFGGLQVWQARRGSARSGLVRSVEVR